MGYWWREKESGQPKYSEIIPFPVPLSFITNPTWTNVGSNSGEIRWERDNKEK
jgi:hypothetical protein